MERVEGCVVLERLCNRYRPLGADVDPPHQMYDMDSVVSQSCECLFEGKDLDVRGHALDSRTVGHGTELKRRVCTK